MLSEERRRELEECDEGGSDVVGFELVDDASSDRWIRFRREVFFDFSDFDPVSSRGKQSASETDSRTVESSPESVDFDLTIFPPQTFDVPFLIRQPSSQISSSIQSPLLLSTTLDVE